MRGRWHRFVKSLLAKASDPSGWNATSRNKVRKRTTRDSEKYSRSFGERVPSLVCSRLDVLFRQTSGCLAFTHALKFRRAQLVLLDIFFGRKPLDSSTSSSSVTKFRIVRCSLSHFVPAGSIPATQVRGLSKKALRKTMPSSVKSLATVCLHSSSH